MRFCIKCYYDQLPFYRSDHSKSSLQHIYSSPAFPQLSWTLWHTSARNNKAVRSRICVRSFTALLAMISVSTDRLPDWGSISELDRWLETPTDGAEQLTHWDIKRRLKTRTPDLCFQLQATISSIVKGQIWRSILTRKAPWCAESGWLLSIALEKWGAWKTMVRRVTYGF